MRESDLKLEKMEALIPTKRDRREVDRYFTEKRKERDVAKRRSGTGKKSGKKKTTDSKSSSKGLKNEDMSEQIKMF